MGVACRYLESKVNMGSCWSACCRDVTKRDVCPCGDLSCRVGTEHSLNEDGYSVQLACRCSSCVEVALSGHLEAALHVRAVEGDPRFDYS